MVVLYSFGLFSAVQPTIKSSASALHASTTLMCLRASRSLLRQVSQVGSCWHFFGSFFKSFFKHRFYKFFLRFWWVLEAKMAPQIDFWRGFWEAFLGPSFWSVFSMHFDVFFKAQLLENSDFTWVKCIFLRFYIFGTCLARGSKMHTKIDGF